MNKKINVILIGLLIIAFLSVSLGTALGGLNTRVELHEIDEYGVIIPSVGVGTFEYDNAGPTFNYNLNMRNLKPDTNYWLVLYANEYYSCDTNGCSWKFYRAGVSSSGLHPVSRTAIKTDKKGDVKSQGLMNIVNTWQGVKGQVMIVPDGYAPTDPSRTCISDPYGCSRVNVDVIWMSASSITVISPNGGETWQAGTTQSIQWSYTRNPGSDVKIELFKGGVDKQLVETITPSTPIGFFAIGSYDWTVDPSLTPETDYQIKITSTTNSVYSDMSDGHFGISAPTPTPLPTDRLTIKVLDKDQQPLVGALIRVSFTSKAYGTAYGVPMAAVDNLAEMTSNDGTLGVFFKAQKDSNNVVIRVLRQNKPWSSCTIVKGYKTLWECSLPANEPTIMASKSTYYDSNTDKYNGGPAYTRIGWTTAKKDDKCEQIKGNWCYADKGLALARDSFLNNQLLTLKPFPIERYKADSIDDYTILGYIENAATEFNQKDIPIPLPVLTAVIAHEAACQWKISSPDSRSCGNSQWDGGWTKITFDGGIGAMQLTAGTALSWANNIGVQPDNGADSLSASSKNNIRAGAGRLNSGSKVKNPEIPSSWNKALISYNGDSGYPTLIKNTIIPFYKPDLKVERYIEDDSSLSHRGSYVKLSQVWDKTCKIDNDMGIWVCQ